MLQGLANFCSSGSRTCGTRPAAQALLFPVLVLSVCQTVTMCTGADAIADRHAVSKYVGPSEAKLPWQL
jgi:alcohol dehydrogenase class IV